jgi:hypothetical protein
MARDPAEAAGLGGRGSGVEAGQVRTRRSSSAWHGPACLVDNAATVPHQNKAAHAKGLRHVQRETKGEPFGIAAAALTEIVEEVSLSSRYNRHLDPARVGAAATIEEDLERLGSAGRVDRYNHLYRPRIRQATTLVDYNKIKPRL